MAFSLAPSENQPTVTWGSLPASALASTVITGSAGWYREKRQSVAEVAPGTSQTSTNALDVTGSTYFRYPGLPGATGFTANPGQYVRAGYKPGGDPQDARWFFNVEFTTSSPTVVFRLNAGTATMAFGRIIVNGVPISDESTTGTGLTSGSGCYLKLEFPDSRQRTITVLRLGGSGGRFGGVAVENGYTVAKPADEPPLFVALGDSYTNGHSEVGGVDVFAFRVAAELGYARGYVGVGIGGTGFANDLTDQPTSSYDGRVADINSMSPAVILVTGGRNDVSSGLQSAVESILSSLTAPAIYVASTASESSQAATRTAIAAACAAQDIAYFDVDIDSLPKISDGIHPNLEGHKTLTSQIIALIAAIDDPTPLVIFKGGSRTSALRVGSTVASRLYHGASEIWPEYVMGETTTEPEPGDEPSEGLFFKLPTAAAASEKKVFAHFFGPYPIVLTNEDPSNDYYVRNFLSVNGESGAHAAYGGLLRDRPITHWPYANPYIQTQMHDEIQNAMQAGIDGFFVNIMGSSGSNWDRYVALADVASASYPDFKVIPMVDANGNMAKNEGETVTAARVNTILSKSSAYRLPDGRYLLGSFKAEGKTLAWWQNVVNTLQNTHGKQIAFVGVYNAIGQAANYNATPQYAAGSWGPGADPGVAANYGDYATAARARGEKILVPVWAQDIRPRSGLFDEARNTGALRGHWTRAINDNADLVQLCTWSDYSEGSQFQPSAMRGHVLADLSAYYIARWKTGSFPAILRDAMYVSHRNQMSTATVTGGQTTLMSHWARTNRSAFREHVEILTFFTTSATVSVKIGASTYSYTAPAGMNVQTYPMEAGHVSAKAVRSGSEIARVNSPVVIKSTTVNQDRQYAMFSSIRGTSEQYDPTPGSPTPDSAQYIV